MSPGKAHGVGGRPWSRIWRGFGALDACLARDYAEVTPGLNQEVDMRKKVAFLLFLLTFVLTLPATANPPALDSTPTATIQAAPPLN